MIRKIMIHTLIYASALTMQAQEKFTELDALIDTMYSVISGPAGESNWNLFKSMFHEEALMGSISRTANGISKFDHFDPEGYIERNSPFFMKNGLFEEELKREIRQFGNIAQIFTSYQIKVKKDRPVVRRGINCVQAVKENGRWYITQLIWQPETVEFKLTFD